MNAHRDNDGTEGVARRNDAHWYSILSASYASHFSALLLTSEGYTWQSCRLHGGVYYGRACEIQKDYG